MRRQVPKAERSKLVVPKAQTPAVRWPVAGRPERNPKVSKFQILAAVPGSKVQPGVTVAVEDLSPLPS